ncbi:hypothetical protein, partial [Rossellomorea marisflavi]|uniref:hypothetical protein n=1 Tax=Rossellomorea marisflavi TaxID=189381 RepID=UPI00295F22C1
MGYLIMFVPFRFGHLLSSGRVLSRFGWRLQGLNLPSIPVGVRWPSLQGTCGGRADGMFDILIGLKNIFYFIDYLTGSCLSA